jgi:hypothetical protein
LGSPPWRFRRVGLNKIWVPREAWPKRIPEVLTVPNDEVLDRLQRIYAAFEAVIDGDLNKFSPKVVANKRGFAMYQDFLGGLNPAQLSNLAHSVIHNIANLQDHLRQWAAKHRQDPKQIEQTVSSSAPLQLMKDLSNNDKHGYPPRNGGHSGKAPKLAEVNRVLRLTTGTAPRSSVAVIFAPTGPKQVVSGGGSSTVVVTATVVDENGRMLGDLYDIEVEALKVWEQQLRALGILN